MSRHEENKMYTRNCVYTHYVAIEVQSSCKSKHTFKPNNNKFPIHFNWNVRPLVLKKEESMTPSQQEKIIMKLIS